MQNWIIWLPGANGIWLRQINAGVEQGMETIRLLFFLSKIHSENLRQYNYIRQQITIENG